MDLSNFNNTVLENYGGKNKCTNFKIVNVIIDSRDRNTSKYPDSANYTIDLPTTYKCVHKIELINIHVHGNPYNIVKNYNDTIYIKEGDDLINETDTSYYSSSHSKYPNGIYTMSTNKLKYFDRSLFTAVKLDPGIYSEDQDGISSYDADGSHSNNAIDNSINITVQNSLAKELSSKLNAQGNIDYKVSYNSKTKKYTIENSNYDTTNNDNFNLLFFEEEKPHGNYHTEVDKFYSFPLHNQNSGSIKYFKKEKERKDYVLESNNRFTKSSGGSDPVDSSDTTVNSIFYSGTETIYVGPPTRKETFYGEKERKYPKKNSIFGTINGGSIGKVIGFDNYNLGGSNSYTSQFCANFQPEPYVILKIPQLKRYQSLTKSSNKSFAVVPINKNEHYDFTTEHNIKIFYQPLPKLDKLSLKFVRQDGSIYDFGGYDHTLIFKIIISRQSDKYCRK